MYEGQSKSFQNFLTSATGHYYLQVLQRLGYAVRRKRREKWQGQGFLHHDNTPSHTSLVVQQFFVEKNVRVVAQPRDLAPSYFLAFPYSKKLASRGHVPQPWRTSTRMRRPTSGGFQKKPLPVLPTMAGILKQVFAHKGLTLKVIR
jgi:hypothetical protein